VRVSVNPFAPPVIAIAAPIKKATAGFPNQISNPARPTIMADKATGMVVLNKCFVNSDYS
jgi:hypothetical protein